MDSFATFSCTSCSIFLSSSMMPPMRYLFKEDTETLSAMDKTPRMPVARRSSVSMAMPLLMASRGWLIFSSLPLYVMVPALWQRRPNRPSISSVRWAPTRPATPRISPLRTVKLAWRKLLGLMEVKSFTSNTTSPGTFSRVGYRLDSSRPTILVIMKSVVRSLEDQVPMYWPSRMMVTSSLMRRISSILWLI